MKYLNKIIRNLKSILSLGFCCGILKAEVVINELFISPAEGTLIPQYIELFNKSDSTVSLYNWSITTLVVVEDETYESSFPFPLNQFNQDNIFATINTDLEIAPHGFFLISSKYAAENEIFYNEYTSDVEVYFEFYESVPGSIRLLDNTGVSVDLVEFDVFACSTSEIDDEVNCSKFETIEECPDVCTWDTDGDGSCYDFCRKFTKKVECVSLSGCEWNDKKYWQVGEESIGHSLRLHSPYLDNSKPENWSVSPETEISEWLYQTVSERKNFGSPNEENALKLDAPNDSLYHDISGDINNIYTADNNYGIPIDFKWFPSASGIPPEDGYTLKLTKIDSWKPDHHGLNVGTTPINSTKFFPEIDDTSISIMPVELPIDPLEVAKFTWTVEFTRGARTIYSDLYSFTIDASDYGVYGCVDDGTCELDDNGDPTCPTSAEDDILISNYPENCTPNLDCFSALNFLEEAKINSKICHYVTLSVPAFVIGDPDDIVSVPVYFGSDSSVVINEINYTLSFDNDIISYQGGTFSGTALFELGDENINPNDIYDRVFVNIVLSNLAVSFNGLGIITYIDFKLGDLEGENTDLIFSEVTIKGEEHHPLTLVPATGGEIIILQPNYEIWGNVVYFTGDDPYEVPNVELTLDKKYDGNSANSVYTKTTNEFGYYLFESLTEGNYSLSFSKEDEYDASYCFTPDRYVSSVDVSRIARHVSGSEPLNSEQLIAGDVSLDGTVSGLDVSLVAQYTIDILDNFNDLNTHWIFKPTTDSTLSSLYADLIYENGQYRVEYKPFVFDDLNRDIYAYRLGDVTGNYCSDYNSSSRYTKNNKQCKQILTHYQSILSIAIMVSEPTYIEGLNLEIGYDDEIFNPLSFTFDPSNLLGDNYESLENLFSKNGTIKTVSWATHDPQIVSGLIGEVSFSWEDENNGGEIWLENFYINDMPAAGGLNLSSYDSEEISDGLNIINKLYPEVLNLRQNYPNPFNPETNIYWSMPNSGYVSMKIYNLQGQFVDILFEGYKELGSHEIIWNAFGYSSGIYFYRLTMNDIELQKKMILLR